jgi:hypothetical protein
VIIKAEVPDSIMFSLPRILASARRYSKRWNVKDFGQQLQKKRGGRVCGYLVSVSQQRLAVFM